MDIKNIFESKFIKGLVVGIAVFVIALIIFQAGVLVGYKKAGFSSRMGDNYYRAFNNDNSQRRDASMMRGPFDDLAGGHGAAGKIVKINLPTFIVSSPDGIEKTVLVTDDTNIRQFRETISSKNLQLDQHVVVLGSPNDDGNVVAKFIRVLPPPSPNTSNAPTSSIPFSNKQ